MFMFPMIWLPTNNDEPPTLYAIMNSMVNFDAEEQTKIKDLPAACHDRIFDFDYPLSTHINKTEFECLILKHFMMRRIGYDTMTAFKIALDVKLNEIMPLYNKLFDSIDGWDLFNDGESITRITNDSGNATMNNTTSNINDNMYSDTPQGHLNEIKSGTYGTDYNYATGSSESQSNSNDSRTTNETINRSPVNKVELYKEFLESKQNVYTMIFKDLDPLFYGLV